MLIKVNIRKKKIWKFRQIVLILFFKFLDFDILSFPCNQFANEMPEADGEEMVCHLRSQNADLGDVYAKVNVNGSDAIPLYNYLKYKQPGSFVSLIKWNFTKFLIDKKGQPVARFSPTTSPNEICSHIDKLLQE